MNEIEPIADVVSGSMAARAAEPSTGLDPSGHTTERNCLNCGTRLSGDYCHSCGQKGHVHRSLAAFGHDLLHGVLHFEGKIFRTLPKLLLEPGELTRRYVAGERARFVSPLALFLFSVFTMFAVVSLFGSPVDLVKDTNGGEAKTAFQQEQREIESRLQDLQQQRAAAIAKGEGTGLLDSKIKEEEVALTVVRGFAGDRPPAPAGKQGLAVKENAGSPTRTVKLGPTDVVGFQPDSALDMAYKAAKENPGLLVYKLQTNAYKFSWALIVISVPFVALLFLWRRRALYDHAVFVTYSITAVSILVIIGSVLVLAGLSAGLVMTAVTFFIPWHMYRQLRGAYGLRRSSALWRTVALVIFANLALGLFASGLLMLGVLG